MTSWRAALSLGLLLAGVLAVPAAGGPDGVTYSRDIAPLLAAHCQSCHRDGEIAPFSLTSYDDAYARRQKILRTVERRKMPPWPPVAGHGDFLEDRRLDEAEITRLRAWVAAGAPEGDRRDLPPPRTFPALWAAGIPTSCSRPVSPTTCPPATATSTAASSFPPPSPKTATSPPPSSCPATGASSTTC